MAQDAKTGYTSCSVEENFHFLRTFWQRYWGRPSVGRRHEVWLMIGLRLWAPLHAWCGRSSVAASLLLWPPAWPAVLKALVVGRAMKPRPCPLLLGTLLPSFANAGSEEVRSRRSSPTCARFMCPSKGRWFKRAVQTWPSFGPLWSRVLCGAASALPLSGVSGYSRLGFAVRAWHLLRRPQGQGSFAGRDCLGRASC